MVWLDFSNSKLVLPYVGGLSSLLDHICKQKLDNETLTALLFWVLAIDIGQVNLDLDEVLRFTYHNCIPSVGGLIRLIF